MPELNRADIVAYLNTGDSYALIGEGVTDWTISGNPTQSTKQYVHQRTATGGVSGYAPTMAFTAARYSGDPAMTYIQEIADNWDTGEKAHTDIVIVNRAEGTATARPARKQKIMIAIDNPGSGPAGENPAITGTFHYEGDQVKGTWNETSKTFTAASA